MDPLEFLEDDGNNGPLSLAFRGKKRDRSSLFWEDVHCDSRGVIEIECEDFLEISLTQGKTKKKKRRGVLLRSRVLFSSLKRKETPHFS